MAIDHHVISSNTDFFHSLIYFISLIFLNLRMITFVQKHQADANSKN